MLWYHAVILGLVEGITEYLPVSSTGHLILASSLLGLDTPETRASVNAFNIVIQGGAILAVLGVYWARVKQMIAGGFGLVGIGKGDPAGLRLGLLLLVAFLPAAVLGVLLDDWIEARLFHAWPVLGALAAGGVYMIVLDRWRTKRGDDNAHEIESLTARGALIIGFMQTLAMWPGTSRSMMTITAGILVGLKPRAAAEFSFLLGLPTLGGACVWSLYRNIEESRAAGEPNMFEMLGVTPILIGLIVATLSAALAVRWLVGFLNRRGLEPFGWYRLALTLALGSLILAGIVTIGTSEPPATDATLP